MLPFRVTLNDSDFLMSFLACKRSKQSRNWLKNRPEPFCSFVCTSNISPGKRKTFTWFCYQTIKRCSCLDKGYVSSVWSLNKILLSQTYKLVCNHIYCNGHNMFCVFKSLNLSCQCNRWQHCVETSKLKWLDGIQSFVYSCAFSLQVSCSYSYTLISCQQKYHLLIVVQHFSILIFPYSECVLSLTQITVGELAPSPH